MIQIVVNGVFIEEHKEIDERPLFRSFSRTFCLIPFNNGWIIISDMLFITLVTDELYFVSKLFIYLSCFYYTGCF